MVLSMKKIYGERADREGTENCALCCTSLDVDKNKRGVIEFFDGWFWICSECKHKVGKTFDCTRQKDYGDHDVIPYSKRSRKYSLRWLEKEYQITIA